MISHSVFFCIYNINNLVIVIINELSSLCVCVCVCNNNHTAWGRDASGENCVYLFSPSLPLS